MNRILFFCFSTLLFTLVSCQQEPKLQADIIIKNARVWTANPKQAWAEAIAIKADTILAVGDNETVLKFKGNKTQMIDGRGKMVTPGFIDSHVHLFSAGEKLTSVKLGDARSKEEFIQRIADFTQKLQVGEWIFSRGWDHQNWGGILPERSWIDSVTPNNPLWIRRNDGHMGLANTLALGMARINPDTLIYGGELIKNENGELTGILKDNAMSLVMNIRPEPSLEQNEQTIKNAMEYLNKNGVTSVCDMAIFDENKSFQYWETFESLKDKGELSIRIYSAVPLFSWERLAKVVNEKGRGDKWLKIGGVKGFMDGSLGSHTAAFHEPYLDTPSDRGLMVSSKEDVYKWIKSADSAGLQIFVHAIGDRANTILLDVFEQVYKEDGEKDRRWRVEHVQHLTREDILRFASFGVVASMQPYHAIDDGRWAEKYIGEERCKTTYAFRDLLDNNTIIAFGSDWSVAPPNVVLTLDAAVNRRTLDGKNPEGWFPEQSITVEEALKAYTIDAAWSTFDEDIKGSLEPGKLADLVILNRDVTQNTSDFSDVEVEMTIVDGKVVYEKK